LVVLHWWVLGFEPRAAELGWGFGNFAGVVSLRFALFCTVFFVCWMDMGYGEFSIFWARR
jgi:hypothetical protein